MKLLMSTYSGPKMNSLGPTIQNLLLKKAFSLILPFSAVNLIWQWSDLIRGIVYNVPEVPMQNFFWSNSANFFIQDFVFLGNFL